VQSEEELGGDKQVRRDLRLGLTLQQTEQQVNGFKSLASSLATGHTHLPLPDISQRQTTEHSIIG